MLFPLRGELKRPMNCVAKALHPGSQGLRVSGFSFWFRLVRVQDFWFFV